FLTKPCPPPSLLGAFRAAVEQNRLLSAERVLLEQTLHGSIRTLMDVLSLTQPLAFGRASRLRRHVGALAQQLALESAWQIEVAAMLSQIGYVTLAPETVSRLHHGEALTDDERQRLARMPQIVEGLIGNIPRLEGVRAIVAGQNQAPRPIGPNADRT